MAFNANDLTSENTPVRWKIQAKRMADGGAEGAAELASLNQTYQDTLVKAGTFMSAEEMGIGNQPGGGDAVEPDPILVASVNITGVSEVAETETITLTATVAPSNADNTAVVWSTSDAGIATVVAGVVTGVAEGNVDITATAADANGAQDVFEVLVVA